MSYKGQQIDLGEYFIHLVVDDDGDLGIWIDHESGRTVVRHGADITDNENQWADRFSPEQELNDE